ncbi:MAG: hypothetical protein V3S82_10240 [Dehalococcoidia bacterium]
MNTTTDLNIEPGDTLLVTFGQGTQLFRVTEVSGRGKPWGFRWNASRGSWQPSSLGANDRRVVRNCGKCDGFPQETVSGANPTKALPAWIRIQTVTAQELRTPTSCCHPTVTTVSQQAWPLDQLSGVTATVARMNKLEDKTWKAGRKAHSLVVGD